MLLEFLTKPKPPSRLGHYYATVAEDGIHILHRGAVVMEIRLPHYRDREGADQLLERTKLSVTPGVQWRSMYGTGSVIVVEHDTNTRHTELQIQITDLGLDIKYEVEYLDDIDVEEEGFTVVTRTPQSIISCNGQIVRQYSDRTIVETTNGDITFNRILEGHGDGTDYWTNWQTKTKDTKDKVHIQVLGPRVPAVRKMISPSGTLATIMVTNHADLQTPTVYAPLCTAPTILTTPNMAPEDLWGEG